MARVNLPGKRVQEQYQKERREKSLERAKGREGQKKDFKKRAAAPPRPTKDAPGKVPLKATP